MKRLRERREVDIEGVREIIHNNSNEPISKVLAEVYKFIGNNTYAEAFSALYVIEELEEGIPSVLVPYMKKAVKDSLSYTKVMYGKEVYIAVLDEVFDLIYQYYQ